MRAVQNNGSKALLAPVDASTAQVVIGHAVAVVQKERQFFLTLFAHSWHSFFSFVLEMKNATEDWKSSVALCKQYENKCQNYGEG